MLFAKLACISFLFCIPLLSQTQPTDGFCEQGGQTITVSGITSSTSTPVQRSYPFCNVTVYVSGSLSVGAGSYTSDGSISGSAGQTCALTLTGGATATVPLTGADTIASGTPLTILDPGSGYSSAPITGTFSNGTATCSGTPKVATTLTPTLATLYSDASNTSLSNPFTANAAGYWSFYASTGNSYAVQFSGGGLPAPYTRNAIPFNNGMIFPGAGIPCSTGSGWCASYGTTGSGNIVQASSPTLVIPNLGTPSVLNLLNATNLQHAALPALQSADIPNNTANTSGNAATATALASAPTKCSPGYYFLGVDAQGNSQGCSAIIGGGTVTASSGPLTQNYLMIGNNGVDSMIGASYIGASGDLVSPNGFSSSGSGSYKIPLSGGTSGTVILTVTSAAGTYTLTLPATGGVIGQALVSTDGAGTLGYAAIPTISGSGPLKGSFGNAVASTYTDYVALWGGGSCSGYLKSDGTCVTPSSGNMNTSGSPATHQVGVFASGTTMEGAGPGTVNQLFVSGGASGDPGYVTTLPTAATPAYTGDITCVAGTVSCTVTKIENVALAGLATGPLCNTTGTGVPSACGVTGTGNVVQASSPTLVTPALGTPSAIVLTNASGLPNSALSSSVKVRTCEIHIWGDGASGALQTSDSETYSCYNATGATLTITAIRCLARGGSTTTTMTPILTGGSSTSIVSGAITCGNASFATGSLNGTPTLTSGSTIDANITAVGTGTGLILVVSLTL